MDEHIFQLVALTIFIFNFYSQIWKSSVSTMIFSTAAAWCAATSTMDGQVESIRWTGVLVMLIAAEIRAIIKRPDDKWIPA